MAEFADDEPEKVAVKPAADWHPAMEGGPWVVRYAKRGQNWRYLKPDSVSGDYPSGGHKFEFKSDAEAFAEGRRSTMAIKYPDVDYGFEAIALDDARKGGSYRH